MGIVLAVIGLVFCAVFFGRRVRKIHVEQGPHSNQRYRRRDPETRTGW